MMIDLDKIAGRMIDLESKYYELQEKYQLLIHHYEDLKAEYETYRSRHRDNIRSQHDLDGSN
jgi:hypothetical protein